MQQYCSSFIFLHWYDFFLIWSWKFEIKDIISKYAIKSFCQIVLSFTNIRFSLFRSYTSIKARKTISILDKSWISIEILLIQPGFIQYWDIPIQFRAHKNSMKIESVCCISECFYDLISECSECNAGTFEILLQNELYSSNTCWETRVIRFWNRILTRCRKKGYKGRECTIVLL